MRLYIWQGEGTSTSYHDDGTLVLLAESEEQARLDFEAQVERLRHRRDAVEGRRSRAYEQWRSAVLDSTPKGMLRQWSRREAWMSLEAWEEEESKVPYPSWEQWARNSARGRRYEKMMRRVMQVPDSSIPERPADIVLDLDRPCIVAFNGGGYD
jgi:hypothetical protein